MSSGCQEPSQGPYSPLATTTKTLVTDPYRLCWTDQRSLVSCARGRLIKVAEHRPNDFPHNNENITEAVRAASTDIRNVDDVLYYVFAYPANLENDLAYVGTISGTVTKHVCENILAVTLRTSSPKIYRGGTKMSASKSDDYPMHST
ncbi:unnamed protein product [Mesocestoides corti]|uniref:Sema domain-containing protein n=1 Tax=Mesocestoides corti TaxID=53468 RepID=A0A0R3UBI5_MESCO|nr:unnamed protein product [Mesocestoides corti]